jgi:GDP/UDP-N,N'-diacetylbacillosamine 2-epimerase (hydrolysing)
MIRKICFITSTRAEFGLLAHTMKRVHENDNLELQIIATGTHLDKKHGETIQEIYDAGFRVDKRVPILSIDDTRLAMARASSKAVWGIAEALDDLRPDLVIVLGDRYEILSAATSAMLLNIPIAHCHGGESTFGLIDEQIRHAITKLSHLHFVSNERYRERVIQLGEKPAHVFNVGALGLESIHTIKQLTKNELESSLGISLTENFFLITFHPVTLDGNSEEQLEELLVALNSFPEFQLIFTMPNADSEGGRLTARIQNYCNVNHEAHFFSSLGNVRYLSLARLSRAVLGNSSSGIIEVPSLRVPSVNIGRRQEGRISGESVIHCASKRNEIIEAIRKGLSNEHLSRTLKNINPYDNGNPSYSIVNVLSKMDFSDLINKRFFDIPSLKDDLT